MNKESIRIHAGAAYLRVDSLPHDEQAPFFAWIFRQTRPVVPSELGADGTPAECAYAWDYARWRAEARPAALADPFDT